MAPRRSGAVRQRGPSRRYEAPQSTTGAAAQYDYGRGPEHGRFSPRKRSSISDLTVANGRIVKQTSLPMASKPAAVSMGRYDVAQINSNLNSCHINDDAQTNQKIRNKYYAAGLQDANRRVSDHFSFNRNASRDDFHIQREDSQMSPHTARLTRARNIFDSDPESQPILAKPWERRSRQTSDALYRAHSHTQLASIFSPERQEFVDRQMDIDAGAKLGWDGLGSAPSTLSQGAYKVAKKALYDFNRSHFPRIERWKQGLRLLERRPTLDELTRGERVELMEWWERRYGRVFRKRNKGAFRRAMDMSKQWWWKLRQKAKRS